MVLDLLTKDISIELLGGTIGGMLNSVVGHPLDLVKATMQSSHTHDNALSAIRHIAKTDGIKGFYKGLSPPIAMAGVINAVVFSVNSFWKGVLTEKDPVTGHPIHPLSLHHVVLASVLTAPIYCIVLVPIEMVKVRMQLQHSSGQVFTGPIDCLKRIVRNEGISAIYSGFGPTLAARVIGLPFFFGGFEVAKQFLMNRRCENEEASSSTTLAAGAIGGVIFWGVNFPLDLIKTNMQAKEGCTKTFFQKAKFIYRRGGLSSFYRGFGPCIVRAAPANAAIFYGHDKTVQFFQKYW